MGASVKRELRGRKPSNSHGVKARRTEEGQGGLLLKELKFFNTRFFFNFFLSVMLIVFSL